MEQLPAPGTPGIDALVREEEGWTVVGELGALDEGGWTPALACAWLTLDVHSALEAVGLTAAVAAVLTERGIPANVLAAHLHDHLLVPVDRADDAVAAIEGLATG